MTDKYFPQKGDRVIFKYDIFVCEIDGTPIFARRGNHGTVIYSHENHTADVDFRCTGGVVRAVRCPFDALYKCAFISRPEHKEETITKSVEKIDVEGSSTESPIIHITHDENKASFFVHADKIHWSSSSGDPAYKSVFDYADHCLNQTELKDWIKRLTPPTLIDRFKNHEIDILVPRDKFEEFLNLCHKYGIKWKSGHDANNWDRFYYYTFEAKKAYFFYSPDSSFDDEGGLCYDTTDQTSQEVFSYDQFVASLRK